MAATLVLACVGIGLGGVLWMQHPAAQTAPPAPAPDIPVTAATVTRQDFPVYLDGLGAVQPINTVLVRARVDGTLMQFIPTEGQDVKQGDPIAVIDPRPFKAALDQATAKRAQDDADLANARHDLARYTSLAKQDFASHQQVDTQSALVNHLVAALAGDDATIESARLNLSFCYITSPIDGRVGLRLVDPGNLVHASDATGIVTITQVHPIAVTFTLSQDELPRITAAMAQQATAQRKLAVIAYASDDRTRLDEGTLLTQDNAIDPIDRHDQAEGDLPERQTAALAEPVRQRASAADDRAQCPDRPLGRRAARPGGAVCLCGHARLRRSHARRSRCGMTMARWRWSARGCRTARRW